MRAVAGILIAGGGIDTIPGDERHPVDSCARMPVSTGRKALLHWQVHN
jgi:hypothetical protein